MEGEAEGETEGEGETIVVKNGDFELDTNDWTMVSQTGMSAICDTSCGSVNGIGASSGSRWAWFGNSAEFNFESATLFQDIRLPSQQEIYLKFDLAIPKSDMPFNLQVLFNGEILSEWTEKDALLLGYYQPVYIDVSDYATGQSVLLAFIYYSHSNLITTQDESAVFVDNVAIE